jgi:hypothetical protein
MLLAVQTIIKGKVTAIPGCAVKAYWGEEVLLHMLTSGIDRGEQPARGQLLCVRPPPLPRKNPPAPIKQQAESA